MAERQKWLGGEEGRWRQDKQWGKDENGNCFIKDKPRRPTRETPHRTGQQDQHDRQARRMDGRRQRLVG